MEQEKINEVVEEIISLYERYGNEDYIGEPVSQIEHMCQCAALAEAEGYEADVVLAAFFHDIGHLCEHIMPEGSVKHMDHFGLVDHEKLGAEYLLQKGFSEKIAKLVASHVDAKRYLTYKFPSYYEMLSVASKTTLGFQGGKMTATEAESFENDPSSFLYIALRRWDEQAKQEQVPLPSLEKYKQLMIDHLQLQHN